MTILTTVKRYKSTRYRGRVVVLVLDAVDATGVGATRVEDSLDGNVVNASDGGGDARNHAGMTRLSAKGRRRHVRRVGLEQDAIERHAGDDLAHVAAVFKRHHARKAQTQSRKRVQERAR